MAMCEDALAYINDVLGEEPHPVPDVVSTRQRAVNPMPPIVTSPAAPGQSETGRGPSEADQGLPVTDQDQSESAGE